jgi:putative peptide zinc metalloprotease protein
MSDVFPKNGNFQLRRDLSTIPVDGHRRAYRIVIDEISGRFSRVSEHVWQSLCRGRGDPQLWREAQAAGWTRHRAESQRRRFSPLYVRIPLGSIDPIASCLAPASGIFFSAVAVASWGVVIALAAVLLVSHSGELVASLGSLPLFLEQADPVWLGMVFIGTKIVHELAHGVMCRRMGSRCGSVGLLMLCGAPCPYCDVTDIWRDPVAARRAAVMLSGVYIELIIAALATFVWTGATDPAVRFHALNLMVVCGISTIVFNANPLMRYDGYYVLGDLVGSTNLRQEARDAFGCVVTARIAGAKFQDARRSDLRSLMLASYHAASTLYRFVVVVAIATLLLALAQYLNLRPIAMGIVTAAVVVAVTRLVGRVVNVARGRGRWSNVSLGRRGCVTLGTSLSVLVLLFCPLPRYRTATGWVDAAGASSVFVPSDGLVESVTRDVGETIRTGQELLKLRSEKLDVEQAKLRGQLRVATLRGSYSRRVTLDHAETADGWKTLQAAEDAVAAQLASVDGRLRQFEVVAPTGGIILPAGPTLNWHDLATSSSLRNRVGSFAEAGNAWCRISPDGRLDAVLIIDARDRTNIDVGTPVRINRSTSPDEVFTSTVTSVSMIKSDDPSVTRQAVYQALCPLPGASPNEMLRWLGNECKGVFHLPKRSLASDLAEWIREWLGGG